MLIFDEKYGINHNHNATTNSMNSRLNGPFYL